MGISALTPPTRSEDVVETLLEFPGKYHMRERQVCPVIDGLALSASAGDLTAQTVLLFMN